MELDNIDLLEVATGATENFNGIIVSGCKWWVRISITFYIILIPYLKDKYLKL
jgi:hypothetical protein